MSVFLFYVISFTWGLPMTSIGLMTALILLISGKKPSFYNGCPCFTVGKRWGGISLGPVLITDENSRKRIVSHEYGHSIQNCMFGPFMPFIVGIPSAVRYNYYTVLEKRGSEPKKDYESVWFEKQATEIGRKYSKRKGV